MRSPTFVIIFLIIMILLDTYVFQALKVVSQSASPKTKTIIYSIYWVISILAIIAFLVFVLTGPEFLPKRVRTYLFATVIGLFLGKSISVVFFLVDDLRAEKYPFKILMSHDPSHWEGQVRSKYPDIDLTLSGHTHGMQFGVEIPGFKWSPVQYVYKQWAGLYEKGKQKLYVNRGFGFIGYPGRVGILPEITVIELA